ncbi:glycosyl transferase family 2 [Tabrizicola sp. TH137]|uniref:glycosyltransferase family 2 protein n=1 Tax=Tabrizicola sp. TH137 TaxID=2067452 RepID=UPI000C7D3BE3|nr:glycosyltransferase family 2 protein [Tabrizicola sp. TH137]PLL13757.1 glycosyl transferase family 2 [Tabrizicola sp. TH137]
MRVLAILTVRNEGSFLLEWLAHHRAAGITDILAFSNDCTDGTDLMLDRLQAMGWLTHLRNDGPHEKGPQWQALKTAASHPLTKAADWILVLDIDEFVNIHVGDRTIAALLHALPEADAIALTWRMFGNAGVVGLTDAPVTETFTRAAPDPLEWPWRAVMFKTLYRNDGRFGQPGVHRPKGQATDRQRWFDSAARPLPGGPPRIFAPLGHPNYRLAQLNHYALGSMEGYLVKADRGRANREASAFDLGYWVDRNLCDAEDRSILALPSQALRADLLADPTLARLHRAAFDWRRARFLHLMRDEGWRALFGRLMMTPPSRALTAAEARLIWTHALREAPEPRAPEPRAPEQPD